MITTGLFPIKKLLFLSYNQYVVSASDLVANFLRYFSATVPMYCVSIPSDGSSKACIDGKAGNAIACGRFSMPSLIGLSPSVISLVVAFLRVCNRFKKL